VIEFEASTDERNHHYLMKKHKNINTKILGHVRPQTDSQKRSEWAQQEVYMYKYKITYTHKKSHQM